METPLRVELTSVAEDLLRTLYKVHGPLMFHQSGGCCDGSSPMCYPAGEFRGGGQDVTKSGQYLRIRKLLPDPAYRATLRPKLVLDFDPIRLPGCDRSGCGLCANQEIICVKG